MSNITLKQLKYFSALRDNGQFGLAAEACCISQPAMSTQIKDLEVKLGKVLFERFPRSVELTKFGAIFSVQVEKTLTAYDDLIDLTRSADIQLCGKLNFGICRSIAPYLLTQIIEALNSSHTKLDLKFVEDSTDGILKDLIERKLDVAIVPLPTLDPLLEEVPLFDEEFVLVWPNQYVGHEATDLKTLPLLKLKNCHFFRNQTPTFWKKMAPRSIEGIDGASLSTLVQMVSMNLGVTLIPEMAVTVETRLEKVSVSRFTSPKPLRTIGLIWRKSSPMADDFTQIADVLKFQPKDLDV